MRNDQGRSHIGRFDIGPSYMHHRKVSNFVTIDADWREWRSIQSRPPYFGVTTKSTGYGGVLESDSRFWSFDNPFRLDQHRLDQHQDPRPLTTAELGHTRPKRLHHRQAP
ncbi:hypothetical protein FRB91_006556 [Serendipita sp. 411]|nr:hypothetical protein FRB91_006556 [Serendipita sp. 411]